MKRIMTMGLALLVAVVASAQVKVAPQMAKGQQKTYTTVVKSDIGGQVKSTSTYDTTYSIDEQTADGYRLSVAFSGYRQDSESGFMAEIMGLANTLLDGKTIHLTVNADGRPTAITNMEQLRTGITASLDAWANDFYGKHPEMAQVMPREEMLKNAMESFDEKTLLEQFLKGHGVLSLNGKTIRNMAQETYTDDLGNMELKMKRMFFVTNGGQTITTNAQADMTPDELKQFIIRQVEENAPEQAEMVKQNIDALVASGMMKVEGTEKTVYTLAADGWMKTIEQTADMSIIGQDVKREITVTAKE